MRQINRMMIHCSDSWWGDAAEFRRQHMGAPKHYADIGYHFVILNGYPIYENWRQGKWQKNVDGLVEVGRPLERIGAHVGGQNLDSIGICLVGRRLFTPGQLDTLADLVIRLADRFKISVGPSGVIGHYELDPGKTCPNIDMRWLRDFIRRSM
jgi:N-acetylmuramoyl-L-alanine amidase